MSCRFPLAPFVVMSWQDEQLLELSRAKRPSLNKRSPSLTLSGSIAGVAGVGVIGSSTPLAVSVGAGNCDGA
jgi:hypothetical protein